MRRDGAPRVVVLGLITKMPVAGVVWQVLHYLEGLRRLGCEVWYVEAHACTPYMFLGPEGGDGVRAATRYLGRIMDRFGFGDRWAYQALHDDGRTVGMSAARLSKLYDDADLILNLHGGTRPLPEHSRTGRLVFIGTDPVQLEVELFHQNQETVEFLGQHALHFTFGENYGRPDCRVPVTDRFRLIPTRQPVVLDFWRSGGPASRASGEAFTTIGNYRQRLRDLRLKGDRFSWSKHDQFERVIDLPRRTGLDFELALASLGPPDRRLLESHGWRVRDAVEISWDVDRYRSYVQRSRAEFTVAKDQNVRLRSGWFSDRAATYLAAGRPVVTQDTGFGAALPTGRGLIAFADLDSAIAAVESVVADPVGHARAATEIARSCFDHGVVIGAILDEAGVRPPALRRSGGPDRIQSPIPPDLVLTPVSRHPLRLTEETVRRALDGSVRISATAAAPHPRTTVVVLARDQRAITRLGLAALLGNTPDPDLEVIVVDNGSTDGTRADLREVARIDPRVRVLLNPVNRGFAAANNQALAGARGDLLVLLNNDTLVTPGWLAGLEAHLADPAVGAVGPVTNRIGNEAQIDASYRTYGEMLELADERAWKHAGLAFEIDTLTMFCLAMRRETWVSVGPLDEQFGLGTLEDDDYSLRIRTAGLRLLCAEDVFVHHFGRASFGELVPDGRYHTLLGRNRERFAQKWGRRWTPYRRRANADYEAMLQGVRQAVDRCVPEGATVLMVSRGDDRLLELGSRTGWHLPQTEEGLWAGHHPASGADAVAALEALQGRGATFVVFPETTRWWLSFYPELSAHLDRHGRRILADDASCTIYALSVVEQAVERDDGRVLATDPRRRHP